jgi:hypothetical protein
MGTKRMKVQLSQLMCLYQFDHVIGCLEMCAFDVDEWPFFRGLLSAAPIAAESRPVRAQGRGR